MELDHHLESQYDEMNGDSRHAREYITERKKR